MKFRNPEYAWCFDHAKVEEILGHTRGCRRVGAFPSAEKAIEYGNSPECISTWNTIREAFSVR